MSNSSVCGLGTYPADVPSYAWRPTVAGLVFALAIVYCFVASAVMVWRRKFSPVRSRSLCLVLFSAFSSLALAVIRASEEWYTPPEFPCDTAFFTSSLFPICVCPVILLRLLRLSQLTRYSNRLKLVKHGDRDWEGDLKRLQTWTKDKPLSMITFVTCLPFVISTTIIYIKEDNLGQGCVNCEMSRAAIWSAVSIGSIFVVACFLGLWYTRTVDDSVHLRSEIIHGVLMWSSVSSIVFLFQLVPSLKEVQDDGLVTPGVWYTIGAIANVTILVTLPTLGTWSIGPYKSFARKYGFLPSKGRSMSIVPGSPALVSRANNVDDWELLDVLTDPVALDSFTEHLASEFSVENIMFWLHAGEFEVACHREVENDRAGDDSGHTSFNHKHMLLRAQWLVDTYLLDTAPLMVNVSSDQREAVQRALRSKKLTPSVFEECRREIYLLMERDPFPRFRRTRRFVELKQKLMASGVRHANPRKRRVCCSCFERRRPHRASLGDHEMTTV